MASRIRNDNWKDDEELKRDLEKLVGEAEVQKYMFTYHSEGQFYIYIVPLGLINIFLHVERDKISCELQPTQFSRNFL